MQTFKKDILNLKTAVENAISNKIDITKKINKDKAIIDFKEKKKSYMVESVLSNQRAVKRSFFALQEYIRKYPDSRDVCNEILELIPELEGTNLENILKTTNKIISLLKKLNIKDDVSKPAIRVNAKIPDEIKAEIHTDIKELDKCYRNACYRSCVILCGRILETILHRKYFEATGKDLLEKSPGIGLGNLIAKMKEKGVKFDPAITQQIHLINQVRIFSVHKKQEAFYPSENQTHAIVLYTVDLLEKLFG